MGLWQAGFLDASPGTGRTSGCSGPRPVPPSRQGSAAACVSSGLSGSGKSIEKTTQNRVLTRAELYETIEETALISLPRSAVDDLLRAVSASVATLGGNLAPISSFSLAQTDWLINGASLPDPKGIIPRVTVESAISKALGNFKRWGTRRWQRFWQVYRFKENSHCAE